MTNEMPIPLMPIDEFAHMSDRELLGYLVRNTAYVDDDEPVNTSADLRATVILVAGRKAKAYLAERSTAEKLNDAVNVASEVLQQFPKGRMGLTPDEVKRSPAWQSAHQNFNKAFQALRNFNSVYTKKFADELRYERYFRRAAGLAPC